MGLKVSRFTGDAIEVSLPAGWRNRGEGGRIHSGAIAALGESTVRMYWDFHLDLKISDVEARRVSMQVLTSPESDLKAVFRLPEVDREAILHRLRVDRSLSLETRTLIYDSVDRLVAEVDIDWHLSRRLTLSGATGHRE
jgi:hypothetical protein